MASTQDNHGQAPRMTKRERVLRALNFESPDRVPVVDVIQHAGVVAHYAQIPEREDWTLEEVGAAMRVALDMVQDEACLTASLPQRTWTDQDGFTRRTDTWVESIVARPFRSEDDAVKYLKQAIGRYQRLDLDAHAESIDRRWRELEALIGDTVLLPALCFDTPYYTLGWELFSLVLMESPGIIADFIRWDARGILAASRAAGSAERTPVVLLALDIAHRTGMLISPKFLREAFFPLVKEAVDNFHARGIRVFYHSEGNLWAVLDDLVACGIDGLNPLEPDVGMDLESVHRAYPDLILWGGIDNADLLPRGTVQEVKEAVERAIAIMDPRGGFLLGSSGQVHPGCKKENVIAMIETAKGIPLR